MTDILDLLNETANISHFETLPMEQIECDTFQRLLMQNEKNEFDWKRIVINKHIVVNTTIQIFGTQSILKFDGGSIQFEGDPHQQNLISGFQIEVYSEGCCFKVSNCGLQLMACTVENMFNSNSYLIEYDNQLHINDTFIRGFRKVARFAGQQINLNVENSKIKCPTQDQSAFFKIESAQEGQISIEMSKFKGSQIAIQITNSEHLNITISESSFSKQQTALILSNLKETLINIERNFFKKISSHALIMESLKSNKVIIERNQIIQCGIGVLLQDVMQFSTVTFPPRDSSTLLHDLVIKDSFSPIMFRNNVLKGMEQTALILKEVVCIQIESSVISENSIGLDINISTDRHFQHEEINPFIITVLNCRFCYNRIHGMFINGNLEKQPIYLQISQSTFDSNRNIMNLSHQGAPQKSNPKLGFKINIHGCSFEENLNSNFFNPYYDVITTKTNIISLPNQNSSKCSIM